jgi:peroxiredoxin
MDFPSDADLAKCVPPEYREMISDQEIENRRWNVKFDFPDHDDATVAQFLINGREFAQDRIDRYVRLNTAEEWRIESGTGDANAAGHPFHIHVNPFQQLIHENVLTLTFAPANPDDKFPSLDSKVKDLRFNSDPKGIALKSKLSFQGVDPRDNSKFETTPIPLEENTTLGDLVNSLQQAFDVRNGMTPGGNGLYRSTLQVATNLANQRTVVRITDSAAGMIDKLQLNFAVNGKASSDFGFEKTRALVDFIWRDTLLAPAGGSAVLRMRFRDWAGKTVLHCHIVDHEDQGMMKNIRILGSDDLLPAELWRAEGAELASDRRLFRRQPVNAPDFDLPDADGTLHRLQEFPGKKVVLFFRGSGCLACNAQLEAYRNAAAKFREAGVTLVAISTTSPDDLRLALKKLGKNQKLPIALLADEKYETFDQYGCLDERDRQPLHGTFVIDAKGKIVWRNVDDEPFMDLKQVLEKCGQ